MPRRTRRRPRPRPRPRRRARSRAHRRAAPWALLPALLLPLARPAPAAAAPVDERGAAATATATAAAAATDDPLYRCKQGKAPVTVTLKPETDVKDLLTWVMSFTCKTFVLDPRIVLTGKKVTIVAPQAMTPAEAYRVFLVALATINLAIVPKGQTYRVVEATAGKKETVPILSRGPDGGEELARYVYRPAYAQAETLRQAFGALKSDAGDIQLIGPILLLTDYGSHLRDMMSLARLVDVPGGAEGVYTIPVQHADAARLAQKLESFLGVSAAGAAASAAASAATRARPDGGGAPGPELAAVPSKIMVDDRTNTLVLAGSEAGYLRVKALVERLDIPLEVEGGAAFHVYRLTSAIAQELAQTLNQAISGGGQPQAQSGAGKPAAPAAPGPAAELGAQLEGPVRVIGDAPTNSLIVMSSGRDFLALRGVIRELDQPRRQVYIEAMILEVAVGDGLQLDPSWHAAGAALGGATAVGSMQTGAASTLSPASLATASGPLFGLLGKSVTLFGQSVPSFGVLLSAVADSSSLNVVSTPSIIALDNEEAKYKIGVNVPFKRASYTGLGGGDAPSNAAQTSFDRRDLVLQLSIKPHISATEDLLLEVKHEAEELQGESENGGGPIWSTRAIETRVVVRDQETVVLGGLLKDQETTTTKKVPLLGDIPLLGHLFKRTERSKRKTSLVILLTPYIIKDQLELAAIRERKTREHDEFMRSFRGLAAMQYTPRIDYGRKRGLVEEIHRTVADIEAEVAARAALRPPPAVQAGVIAPAAPAAAGAPAAAVP